VLLWVGVGLVLLAVGLLGVLHRRDLGRLAAGWDALARSLTLGFDPASRSIHGRYRLLRVELTAERTLLGLGPWRTRISAGYEGVVPEGLDLRLVRDRIRASARDPAALDRWLDGHRRRELLPGLLRGGVQVLGHEARLEMDGLLSDAEILRGILARLADLARLLSQR